MHEVDNPLVQRVSYSNWNSNRYRVYLLGCVLTLGFLHLVFEWFPGLFSYFYTKTEDWETAQYIICHTAEGNVIEPLHHRSVLKAPLKDKKQLTYFHLYHQLYYLSRKRGVYVRIENRFLDSLKKDLTVLRKHASGVDEQTVRELRAFYGKNEITIEVLSLWRYMFIELKRPVSMFIIVVSAVIAANDSPSYGIVLLVFMAYAVVKTAMDTRNSQQEMYEKGNYVQRVTVLRQVNNAVVKIDMDARELVVGDVVLVKSKDQFTCDMIQLSGQCLVSEAVLTGEANSVSKTGMLDASNNGPIALNHRSELCNGAQCLLAKTDEVRALVVKTGWNTTKGALISDMLNMKMPEYKFKADTNKIIVILLILVSVIAGFIFVYQYTYTQFNFKDTLNKNLELLLTALPPELFFSLYIGLEIASGRLAEKKISCQRIEKINEAARIKAIGFDKTGTLTDTNVQIYGYLPAQLFNKVEALNRLEEHRDPNHNEDFAKTMACCHSLNIIGDAAAGDPLEEEIFKLTGFSLEEKYDKKANRVLKFVNPSEQFRRRFNLVSSLSFEILEVNEFSADRRCSSVVITDSHVNAKMTYLKGAPEFVKTMCKPATIPDEYDDVMTQFSKEGYRTLAFAKGPTVASGYHIEKDLEFVGFVALCNPLKRDTTSTIRELRSVDIQTFIVSGDNLYISLNIGFSSGLIPRDKNVYIGEYDSSNGVMFKYQSNADIKTKTKGDIVDGNAVIETNILHSCSITKNCIPFATMIAEVSDRSNIAIAVEGKAFEELFVKTSENDEFLDLFLHRTVVYARASPEQKAMVMDKFKAMYEKLTSVYCVAFVGDGSNDCKALKTANIGLSIGNNESSIASSFSTTDQSIRSIIYLMVEGRASLSMALYNFKFILVGNLITNTNMVILIIHGLMMSFTDHMICDMLIMIPLALYSATTRCEYKLNKNIPRISIINLEAIVSILTSLGIAAVFIVVFHTTMIYDMSYKDPYAVAEINGVINVDKWYYFQGRYSSLLVNLMVIGLYFAFNRSYPFRKSMTTNLPLISYVIFLIILMYFLLLNVPTGWIFLDTFIRRWMRQPTISLGLKSKFVAICVLAPLTVYLAELIISTTFLILKRKLNELDDKKKTAELGDTEAKEYDHLAELVSLN